MPDTPTPDGLAYDVERLNLALIEALGFNPQTVAGVRLDVFPGTTPQVTVFRSLVDPGDMVASLTAAVASTSYALLPGQDPTMPAIRDHNVPDLVPLGTPLSDLEPQLLRLLPMLTDVVHGCQFTDDQRAEMTTLAETCEQVAHTRVWMGHE